MKTLYFSIKQYLTSKLPQVFHVDKWNNQLANLETETPFLRPTIFIEFGDVAWEVVNKNSKRGSLQLTFHVVTDCYNVNADDGDTISAFTLLEEVERCLDNAKLSHCTPLSPSITTIDHNHGDLIENTLTYTCQYTKCISDGKDYSQIFLNPDVKGRLNSD